MSRNESVDAVGRAAEAVFEELQAWCDAHPKYTLMELEEQARVLRQKLMGQMISNLVAQRDGSRVAEGVICEESGREMEDKGQRSRTVRGPEGPLELHRTYYYCPSCKEGIFPLDRELRLTRRPWTEAAEKGMARLGALIPSYRMAAQTYGDLVGLAVSASTLEDVTTVAGQRLRELEAREAESSAALPVKGQTEVAGKKDEPVSPVDHLCISLDGARVNTHEGWRELKLVSVSEVEPLKQPTPEGRQVALVNHSYRAGFWEAQLFGKVQWAEARRRGVEVAKRLSCVNDGAVWIWALVLLCYPLAVQVVDWWHAVDRLWKVGNLVLGQGEKAQAWVEARKDELWAGRVQAVIAALGKLKPQGEEAEKEVRLLREYLREHADRMRYQQFREEGVPIGSGTVESGCKNVVGSRMKRGGMRWKVHRAEAVLALRCNLLSDRWHQAWESQRQAA